ncbi:MAG: hypothetical protein J3R72DRAFT_431930 [Linnemannia gamsii]|nr:MAG: hypothetical protein J3R72DRAFT_431930 [Linnemannia gamsii]
MDMYVWCACQNALCATCANVLCHHTTPQYTTLYYTMPCRLGHYKGKKKEKRAAATEVNNDGWVSFSCGRGPTLVCFSSFSFPLLSLYYAVSSLLCPSFLFLFSSRSLPFLFFLPSSFPAFLSSLSSLFLLLSLLSLFLLSLPSRPRLPIVTSPPSNVDSGWSQLSTLYFILDAVPFPFPYSCPFFDRPLYSPLSLSLPFLHTPTQLLCNLRQKPRFFHILTSSPLLFFIFFPP